MEKAGLRKEKKIIRCIHIRNQEWETKKIYIVCQLWLIHDARLTLWFDLACDSDRTFTFLHFKNRGVQYIYYSALLWGLRQIKTIGVCCKHEEFSRHDRYMMVSIDWENNYTTPHWYSLQNNQSKVTYLEKNPAHCICSCDFHLCFFFFNHHTFFAITLTCGLFHQYKAT